MELLVIVRELISVKVKTRTTVDDTNRELLFAPQANLLDHHAQLTLLQSLQPIVASLQIMGETLR